MLGLVIGTNREAAASLGQKLAAAGVAATVHHLVHLPDTLDHLRRTACDVIVFLCDAAPGGGAHSLNAPACSGHCLPRQLRAHGILVPLLVIASHGPNWTGCLAAGADAHLAAPSDERVLVESLRALSRRHQWSRSGGSRLQVGDLTLDRKHRTATRAGKPIALSPRETDLLEYLMTHAGEICSPEDICVKAWGCVFQPGSNNVYTHINRLREKIDDGFPTRMIENVRGDGYMLNAK